MSAPDSREKSPETTVRLIERIRGGDLSARDVLIERYFDRLNRWGRGRLPRHARFRSNTEDLVQDCFIRALSRLEAFEARGEGSFLAYLRTILRSRIVDEIRAAGRRPFAESLDDVQHEVEEDAPSPVEEVIGAETFDRYEKALERLPARQQEAVIMRIELQFTYQQIADALGMSTANAVRMMISRAIVLLAETMKEAP